MFNKTKKKNLPPDQPALSVSPSPAVTVAETPDENPALNPDDTPEAEEAPDTEESPDPNNPDNVSSVSPETNSTESDSPSPCGEGRGGASGASEAPISPVEEAYCIGAGIGQEALLKAKALINEVAGAAADGSFSPRILNLAFRMLNYERDVEAARNQGIASAKTEAAAAEAALKESRAARAAAIPRLRSANRPTPLDNSIFAIAKEAM